MIPDLLKQHEEEKRERCWDARERWRVLQETIAWVDSQQAVPRNSNRSLRLPRNHAR